MGDTDTAAASAAPRPGRLKRLWRWFFSPTGRYAWGMIIVVGFVVGVAVWGSFNWALELTNTESFCISCHEMKDNVYAEYRNTTHYSNRTGVRASCPDCHVPKEWTHKVVRKIQASNELLHKMLGSIDTQEKFAAHRLVLAKSVWRGMKTTDSRECRNCHKFDHMEYSVQEPRASKLHQTAFAQGKTCVDCHQGVAHKLPPKAQEAYREMLDHIDEVGPLQKLIDFLQDADVARAKAAR